MEKRNNKNNLSTKRKRISLIKLNKSSSQRNIFNKFQFKININPQNKNNNKNFKKIRLKYSVFIL